jgi:hypothetical protein
METTRAADLVIKKINPNKPFKLANSVCNNPPNTYHLYTLNAFITGIDDPTKELLFCKPIWEVYKKYLETHLPLHTPGQSQSAIIQDHDSTVDGSSLLTLIYSPPQTHHIKLDYRSILQVLNTKWDDNQKSIWKIYDEVQRVNKQDVQSMEAIANSLVQLRNIYRRYPYLDVSESPF